METNNVDFTEARQGSASMSQTFVANVFLWMFAALAITSIVSYTFAHNANLIGLLVTESGLSILGYIVMFSPIAFVFAMSLGFNKMSYQVLLLLFITYAAVMGASLSFIFLAYTAGSIYTTFMAASGMFGLMAVVGYTTKTDLTNFGSIMMMALVGLIIASVINMFMHSDTMEYIISFIGVLVFTGLTAYDVQKLKNIGAGLELGTASASKLVIMGALTLYLDFINLFLFLLRLFGDRK
jgi:uncharacterized protein